MAKAPSISDAARIGQEVAKASKAPRRADKTPAEDLGKVEIVVTSISLPEDLLHLLQDVARKRLRTGTRAAGIKRMSASALIVEILERHRAELEAER